MEEGSFRRAAERLGVTQPHVSQSLRRLEEKYGAMIVDRHASPLRLTPLGEVVYDSLRRMALIEVETLQQCADFKELRTGRVRVACNAERSISILMPVAAAFARAYPKVELDLTLDLLLEDVPDALASGRADVGVLFQRLMTPDLNAYPLVEERYLLAVPDAPEYANVGVPFNDEGIYPKAASVDLTPITGLPFLCPNNHQERKELLSRALGIPVHAMPVMALNRASGFRLWPKGFVGRFVRSILLGSTSRTGAVVLPLLRTCCPCRRWSSLGTSTCIRVSRHGRSAAWRWT